MGKKRMVLHLLVTHFREKIQCQTCPMMLATQTRSLAVCPVCRP